MSTRRPASQTRLQPSSIHFAERGSVVAGTRPGESAGHAPVVLRERRLKADLNAPTEGSIHHAIVPALPNKKLKG
jgi:hypothetical protein